MKKILLVAFAVAGLATACRKNDDEVACPAEGPVSIDGFLKRHAPPVQVFTFDPTRAQTIRTASGARLEIQPNAFVRMDGIALTGPLRLEFQEVYTPSEMILMDMPTIAHYARPLESGGEFNIKVFDGDTRVMVRRRFWFSESGLRLTSAVPARVAADTRDRMLLWRSFGKISLPDSITWMPVVYPDTFPTSQIPLLPAALDTTSSAPAPPLVYTNALWPDTLGWLNYDVYPTTSTRIRVFVAGEFLADQRVYLIPNDRNGAFRPYWTLNSQFEQPMLPLGTDLTAVILRVKDGKYYFGTHRAPAADGFVYRPVLEEVSEEELVRRIRLL